jgi:hypothetical protein
MAEGIHKMLDLYYHSPSRSGAQPQRGFAARSLIGDDTARFSLFGVSDEGSANSLKYRSGPAFA